MIKIKDPLKIERKILKLLSEGNKEEAKKLSDSKAKEYLFKFRCFIGGI